MATCQEKDEPLVSYESNRCNIVILGRTGSGKSTIANKILCYPCFGVDSKQLFKSKTGKVRSGERAIKSPGDVYYSVKIVDTKGFQDPQTKPEDILTDIKLYFRKAVVEGVSLVLFVMPRGRLLAGEVATIKMIEENFLGVSSMSALVMTHCEGLKSKIRDGYEQEFRTSEETSSIAKFMKKGIFTVGFPDLSQVVAKVRPFYEKGIKDDVKKLHNLIYESTQMHLTAEMFYREQFWEKVKETQVIDSNSQCSIM